MVVTVQLAPQQLLTRYMTIKLILDKGEFPSAPDAATGQPQNVKTITCNSDNNSLSAEVVIQKAGGILQNTAYVKIFGMSIADCNAFTRFNLLSSAIFYQNTIEIYAGYSVGTNGMPPLVYRGQIVIAGTDFDNPSRPFVIDSLAGIYYQNQLAPHTNPSGDISLDTLFRSIIAKAQNPDLVYTPNNVSGNASNVVYTGSWVLQLRQACNDYQYTFNIDGNNVLVAPIGSPLVNATYNISKDTGMIGYPKVVQLGIDVRVRFDPTIQFGQQIQVTSALLTIANGLWFINGMAHTLYNRGPKWESVLKLNKTFFNE